jgi:hypothetical protein
MAHAQKPNFVSRRNGRVHSVQSTTDSRGVRITGSNTPCSEVVRRVLAIHYIRQFPLNFPSRASPCAITFQLESTAFVAVRKWHGMDDGLKAWLSRLLTLGYKAVQSD